MNIGFIGTGKMGTHMVHHILGAGYNLAVHDLNKEVTQNLLKKGAIWVDTPKDMAESCNVILSSLPGPSQVEEVVYGKSGLMAGWKKGDIYVDTTTSTPTLIRRVSKDAKPKGVAVLDAPLSGGPWAAEQGTLVFMVGGDARSLQKVRKVLEAMGKIFHVGGVGCGSIVKLVNNIISSTCNAITAESFVLGVKAGIDAKKLREVIMVSTGNTWILERTYPQTVFKGNFEPGFRLSLALKDIGLALALGKEYNVPQPIGAAVEQRFLDAKAAGFGDRSTQALILRLEELCGVQVRSPE